MQLLVWDGKRLLPALHVEVPFKVLIVADMAIEAAESAEWHI